jgi:hypothetical protein
MTGTIKIKVTDERHIMEMKQMTIAIKLLPDVFYCPGCEYEHSLDKEDILRGYMAHFDDSIRSGNDNNFDFCLVCFECGYENYLKQNLEIILNNHDKE